MNPNPPFSRTVVNHTKQADKPENNVINRTEVFSQIQGFPERYDIKLQQDTTLLKSTNFRTKTKGFY